MIFFKAAAALVEEETTLELPVDEVESVTLHEAASEVKEEETTLEMPVDELEQEENIQYILLEVPTTETIDYTDLINSLSKRENALYELVSLEYDSSRDNTEIVLSALNKGMIATRVIMVVILLIWLYMLIGKVVNK